jgi:hypothetical protein
VNHLQHFFAQDNVAIIYVYCDYKDQTNQTDRNMFASLAKQSILQQTTLPPVARTLYSQCKNGEASPSSQQSLDLLRSSMDEFRRTFIVLDALDEHLPSGEAEYSPHIPLLYELHNMQRRVPGRCTMLITSRVIDSIQEQMDDSIRLDIKANDEDIRSFVSSRIYDDKKFTFAKEVKARSSLAHEIVERLVEKAQGMSVTIPCLFFPIDPR